jgi:photosystem II stability/assembly factor-like uncharacterized protein
MKTPAIAVSLAHTCLAACAGVATISLLAACGVDRPYARWNDVAPDPKPAGVAIVPESEEGEIGHDMGPPPYEYWRITGEPVPGWDTTPGAGLGGYTDRDSPFRWQFLGPKPIEGEYWSNFNNCGGRVVGIAPHPVDPDIVYIATASGGIWKTIDGGDHWDPLTDSLPSLNHGAIALEPQDPTHVYIATGEYETGSVGDGIFKSVDSGQNWTRIATAANVGPRVSAMAISPRNPSVIHVTGSSGYFYTVNGGTNWTTVIGTSCSALKMDPSNPSIIYVARRSVGIYKTLNSGGTMQLLTGGLPTTGFDRIVMDISPSNPQVLYAAFLRGGNVVNTYKTVDGGVNWTLLSAVPNFCSAQCWYDAYIRVHPLDENRIFLGGVDPRYAVGGIMRSDNGGATWREVSQGGDGVHPDHHFLAFGANNILWEGNDGGVVKSTDGGLTWTNKNSTLAATQMYHVAVHPRFPERILAGTQDNGTPERSANQLNWPNLQTGDGGFSAYDWTNTTRRYTTYVYLTLYRWENDRERDISGPWNFDAVNFIAPFVLDPNAPATVVAGTERVWRTTNSTSDNPDWNAISTNEVAGGGTLNAVAVANGNSSIIYSGSSRGDVWVTTNATAPTPTWTDRSTGLGGGPISNISINPYGANNVFVGSYSTTGGRIFRTDNYGFTWRNVTGTLPAGAAVRALAIDYRYSPPIMYVGSGSGVYVSLDAGATWTKNDNTFPNVNVGGFDLNPVNNILTVGTYGRGVWRTPLVVPAPCIGDYNRDGGVDGADIESFFLDWQQGFPEADLNQDGGVDGGDIETFFLAWEAGC